MIVVEWMFVQVDLVMFLLSVAIFFKQNMYSMRHWVKACSDMFAPCCYLVGKNMH